MKTISNYIIILGEVGSTRWIIRNQWSKYASGGFKIIEIGRGRFRDRREFMITILGISLVVFIGNS